MASLQILWNLSTVRTSCYSEIIIWKENVDFFLEIPKPRKMQKAKDSGLAMHWFSGLLSSLNLNKKQHIPFSY